ncbi:SMI1/KNR4 family protein [Streptomyces phaeofaciens]|uniref:hypothetical protein n=1 Tax=Streptomyces phaeofaciens TaxID=68254 RepID=UPI0036A4BE2D
MTDYLAAVQDLLGPPENRYADPAAWAGLEAELGLALPSDYKTVVDGYAPATVNVHLSLTHPATTWWNLSKSIRDTSEAWARTRWQRDWAEGSPSDPRVICGVEDLAFGTRHGLIPLAHTDRGDVIFLAPQVHGISGGICVACHDGDWAGYPMPFAEWLYRFLIGEDMAGYKSAALYPGPVRLEYPPMGPGDQERVAHGPERSR